MADSCSAGVNVVNGNNFTSMDPAYLIDGHAIDTSRPAVRASQ